jgi:hypothetical protein
MCGLREVRHVLGGPYSTEPVNNYGMAKTGATLVFACGWVRKWTTPAFPQRPQSITQLGKQCRRAAVRCSVAAAPRGYPRCPISNTARTKICLPRPTISGTTRPRTWHANSPIRYSLGVMASLCLAFNYLAVGTQTRARLLPRRPIVFNNVLPHSVPSPTHTLGDKAALQAKRKLGSGPGLAPAEFASWHRCPPGSTAPRPAFTSPRCPCDVCVVSL